MSSDGVSLYLDRLDELIQNIMRRVHIELAESAVHKITGTQFVVLKFIHWRGRTTVSGLADDLYVSLSAVTSLVDRLHRAGLVSRERDESDRRVVWLSLTDRGREVLDSCLEVRRRVMKRYLNRLGEEDVKRLIQIYEKLLQIMEEESEQHAGGIREKEPVRKRPERRGAKD